MIRIHNGTHDGEPIATLVRHDGTLLDVYEPQDAVAALAEIVGPIPEIPVMGFGYFDVTQTPWTLYNADGSTALVMVPQLSYVAPADGINAALASAYTAKAASYNAMVAAVQAMLAAALPAMQARYEQQKSSVSKEKQ